LNTQIHQIRPVVEFYGCKQTPFAGSVPFLKDVSNGGGSGGIALESFPDGNLQFRSPIIVKQLQQLTGLTAGGFSTSESCFEQSFAFGNSLS